MRRFIWLVFLPAVLAAQRPAVSPVLPRLLSRVQDTTVSVWLFARPTASLDTISARVAALGARVRVQSRWLHAVSADVPAAALRRLLEDRQLHLRPLTDQGMDATGVRVGIFDTGFDTANPAFNGITITAQHDFVFNDDIVRDEPGKDVLGAQSHGTSTWSLFAGEVAGRLHGIARGASFLLAKTEDGRIKPDFTAPGVAVCVLTGVNHVLPEDGTSFATPILAAGAALVKQIHPTLLPMDLRAAFRRTATKRAAPDSSYGWGRPDVAAAAVFPNGVTATSPLPAGG